MVLEAAKDLMPRITIIQQKVSIVAFSHFRYDRISNLYQLEASISNFRAVWWNFTYMVKLSPIITCVAPIRQLMHVPNKNSNI